ncbi:replication/maintenance protein RepL [Pseudobutyrivibrio ruminis]|uniref:replication/maintenance protein RepL n=1 Tax=Pseudobutyrivibrio ruminis TaxID=46206 RepID=UPI00051C984C|nr:replication/maintenance protein RepL [Pseudobutyrivibrio ruminis]
MIARKRTKTKYKQVGTQEYINKDTGELVSLKVESTERRDFNFHKIWLAQLTDSMEGIFNQKTKVAFWILNHLNRENQLIYTQNQIASKVNVSIQTVNLTFKEMMQADLIRKANGAYIVNPDIVFKGTINAREKVWLNYVEGEAYNSAEKARDDKTRLSTLQKQIEKLKRQEETLKASIQKAAT